MQSFKKKNPTKGNERVFAIESKPSEDIKETTDFRFLCVISTSNTAREFPSRNLRGEKKATREAMKPYLTNKTDWEGTGASFLCVCV